jgi:type II secretory pathway component PulC
MLAMCAAIAAPAVRSVGDRELCQNSLKNAAIKINATGVEEEQDWAIVKLGGFEEDVVSVGDELHGCYRVLSVSHKSVVLENRATHEQREFFLSGYSTAPSRARPSQPTTNQDFVDQAMERHKVVRESDTVERIEYPLSTNFAHLPKLVYHNRSGSSFYGDYQALGLGERLAYEDKRDPSSHIQGVRINEPSRDSFFGSLGLKDGQKIVAINGHFVSSPEQISRLLEEREGNQLSLGYYDPETRMILSTHGVINSM